MIVTTLWTLCVAAVVMLATVGVLIMLAMKFDKRLTQDDDEHTTRR